LCNTGFDSSVVLHQNQAKKAFFALRY